MSDLSRSERLKTNLHAILTHALPCNVGDEALVIYDEERQLTRDVLAAYRELLPWATFISFPEEGPEVVKRAIDRQSRGALVVLIQSSNFRLDAFRIRLELFRRGLRTIEHGHLERLTTQDEAELYVDSLAYDPAYYHRLGEGLTELVAQTSQLRVRSRDGSELVFQGPFEEAKKNIGDYRGMENVGGTFPIGEVFTEAVDLTAVNGTLSIFGYGGMDFRTRIVTPFTITVEAGMVVGVSEHAPQEFHVILAMVRANELPVLREIGFGLNRAFGKERVVADITTFERQLGLHVSLGEKHTIYRKEGMKPKETKYHIDLFVDVDELWFDDWCGFKRGDYVLSEKTPQGTHE